MPCPVIRAQGPCTAISAPNPTMPAILRRRRSRFSALFLNVNLPFQKRALFNGYALRGHIARYNRRLSQLYTIGGVHTSIQCTLNHYGLGADVGLDLSVRPDREAVVAKLNVAFDAAIHVQVFGSRQLSLDYHRLADVGKFSSLRRIHPLASILLLALCSPRMKEL